MWMEPRVMMLAGICYGQGTHRHFIDGNWMGNVAKVNPENSCCAICWASSSGLPPDKSSVKHLWDVLCWCVCQQPTVPQNGCQLQVAPLEEWDNDNNNNLPGDDRQPGDVYVSPVYRSAWGDWWTHAIEVCELGPLTPLTSCVMAPGLLFWNWCYRSQIQVNSLKNLSHHNNHEFLSVHVQFDSVYICIICNAIVSYNII